MERFSGVGIVAIDYDVIVSIDLAEHLAHHVALTLARFGAHDSTVIFSDSSSIVLGIVIVDVDIGIRQYAFEIVDHFADRDRFVIAGDEHRNFVCHRVSFHSNS